MPEPISDAFRAFDALVRPAADDLDDSAGFRDGVEAALRGRPGIIGIEPAGSFSHGTAVRGSRLDLLVVLDGPRSRSATRAAESLAAAVPGDVVTAALGSVSTAAGRVVLDRVGGIGLHLIPAYAREDSQWVPDAAGRWVRHRPGAREMLLDRIDDDGSLRALIRLLLAWKHRQGVPVSSYYLETAAIRQSLQQRSFSLLWDLCWLWESLASGGLVNLPDLSSPDQTQGVRPAASLGRAIEVQFPVERAASSARGAVNAYLDGDLDTAHAYLVALFGGDFPELAPAEPVGWDAPPDPL